MKRWLVTAVAVFVAVSLIPASGQADEGEAGGAFERSVVDVRPSTGRSFTVVAIDNALGNVRVIGHDADELVIIANKRAPDRATLERVKVSLVPDPSGPVSIQTRLKAGLESRPVPAGTIRVDLEVRAPRDAVVRVRTWNGHVAVEGVDNGAELTANEGDIDVSRVLGAVSTTSAQGKHQLDDIIGEVTTRALYGDIKLDWIRGRRLQAVVHNGRIFATRIESKEIDLRALRGDLSVELNPRLLTRARLRAFRGDIAVTSRRGPIAVEVASKGDAKLDPSMSWRRRSDGVWANGAKAQARLSIRTGLGNVVFAVHGD